MAQQPIELILMRELADLLATPMFVVDGAGGLVFYNELAEELLGRRFEETGPMPAEEWSTIFGPLDTDGNPMAPADLPLVIALREGHAEHTRSTSVGSTAGASARDHGHPTARQRRPARRCGRVVLGSRDVNITLWGTRGSLASPGPDTVRYGGNTSCVEVRNDAGQLLVLDAGTGIRRLAPACRTACTGSTCSSRTSIWTTSRAWASSTRSTTPSSRCTSGDRRQRHSTCSPASAATCHHRCSPSGCVTSTARCTYTTSVPDMSKSRASRSRQHRYVTPALTLGYRIEADGRTLAYLSDHEPMLCVAGFALGPEWISGHALADDVDVLLHDAQFTAEEYETRVGWGHSTLEHAAAFAASAGARRLVPFHHDPGHDDSLIDKLHHDLPRALLGECELTPMGEGETLGV